MAGPGSSSLSVVVPTRDRPQLLAACLASLRAAVRPDDEIVVVDSASQSPAVEQVARDHGARYLRCPRPGTSRARNLGWRQAGHDLVAFVDDDVRVLPGWATAMRAAFADTRVAFATGRILLPPGTEWTDVPVATLEDPDPAILDAGMVGVLGHGANAAARRPALDAVGGFDERMGPGTDLRAAEDNDLFDRLLAAGCEGRYEPEAAAWHEQWRSRRQLVPLNWAYGVGSGARLAKLLRLDPRRAGAAARVLFWEWGLADVRRWLPHFRLAALLAVVRMVAAATGLARALPLPVRDGHFAPGPSPTRRPEADVLVSVVMPCRNAAAHLGDALAALAAEQLQHRWEVVIADNGSTDGTREVVRRFEDVLDVRVVDASGRRGPWFARNVGAAAAAGDLLIFLDADDIIAQGYLGRMVEGLGRAGLAAGRQEHERLNPGWMARSRPVELVGGLNDNLGFLPYASSCCIGIRREVFESLGGFAALRTCEDIDLCWRAQLAGHRIEPVPDAVLHYRFRTRPAAVFKQGLGYGRSHPALYRRYRHHGMPRPVGRQGIQDWRYALDRLLRSTAPAERSEGAYLVGLALGRAVGSARHGVPYL
jgi:glycosyltransferase involved in cell wall biosynthesis